MSEIEIVRIEHIVIDESLQMRVATQHWVVDDYATLMSEGVEFPPISLFWDTASPTLRYLIVDGNHRYLAAKKNGYETIAATVQSGDYRTARIAAMAANANHGLPLSSSDKHRIALQMLIDDDLSGRSDRDLSRINGSISQPFISAYRRAIKEVRAGLDDKSIMVEAGGLRITYTMLANIRAELGIYKSVVKPAPVAVPAVPAPAPIGKLSAGDNVITRTGREGVVTEVNARAVMVETVNGVHRHNIETLKPAAPVAAPPDKAAPTMVKITSEDVKKLADLVKALYSHADEPTPMAKMFKLLDEIQSAKQDIAGAIVRGQRYVG